MINPGIQYTLHNALRTSFNSSLSLSLRPETDADIEFLRNVYASTRAEEMSLVPWSAVQKQQFLAQQFELQHQDYQHKYADAEFLIIESADHPIGRIYLHNGANELLLINIALLPEYRGLGIGSLLLQTLQSHAANESKVLRLHVDVQNFRAQQLYSRLGFVLLEEQDFYLHLEWSAVCKTM